MSDAIEFNAQIFKIQTLADGGIRLTVDMQENTEAAIKLIQAKQQGAYFVFAVVPFEDKTWRDQQN